MRFTDETAIKLEQKARNTNLSYHLESLTDEDREDRSDMQILADECSYLVELYEEDGNTYNDELFMARKLLRETKYGKVIPLDIETFRPKRGYDRRSIQDAKEVVNEYNRLKRLFNKLSDMGY